MLVKTCTKCGKAKLFSHFLRDSTKKTGLNSRCKTCIYFYRNSPNTKALKKKYDRSEKAKKAKKLWGTNNRSKVSKMNALYKRNNQEKIKAHKVIERAIEKGELIRGKCFICKTDKHIHGHHVDYRKQIDVMWLCKDHHAALHVAERMRKHP